MLWGIAFAMLIVALMIPLVAVLRDARLQRGEGGPSTRLDGRDTELEQLTKRVLLLEDELDTAMLGRFPPAERTAAVFGLTHNPSVPGDRINQSHGMSLQKLV